MSTTSHAANAALPAAASGWGTCPTCGDDFHWFPDRCNEQGWRCCGCDFRPGEPAGYCPQLDRSQIGRKVDAVLHHLCDAKVVYLSNGTAADGIQFSVAQRIRDAGTYDQWSIAMHILQYLAGDPNGAHGHAAYWKRIGEGVINGSDERPRCYCGALAERFTAGRHFCSSACESQQELPL